MEITVKASSFAAEKHKFQKRKADDTPYINHPLEVAYIIINIGDIRDPNVIAAAILHDTLEDTQTTYEELVNEFGSVIASYVKEVSDDRSLSKDKRKQHQIEHAKEISSGAKLIKLADKLHNLTSLISLPPPSWSKDTIEGYFVWSSFVIDSMRGTNLRLETQLDSILSLKITPDMNREEILKKYYQSF